jgi:hypothetical protein
MMEDRKPLHPRVILRRAEGETGGPSNHMRGQRLLGVPVNPRIKSEEGHDRRGLHS